jgi:hypothetical protein
VSARAWPAIPRARPPTAVLLEVRLTGTGRRSAELIRLAGLLGALRRAPGCAVLRSGPDGLPPAGRRHLRRARPGGDEGIDQATVSIGCPSWSWLALAIPAWARPRYQARKPRDIENTPTYAKPAIAAGPGWPLARRARRSWTAGTRAGRGALARRSSASPGSFAPGGRLRRNRQRPRRVQPGGAGRRSASLRRGQRRLECDIVPGVARRSRVAGETPIALGTRPV